MEIISATVIEEYDEHDRVYLTTDISVSDGHGTAKLILESSMPRGHGYAMVDKEFPHLQARLTSTSGGRSVFKFFERLL